MSGRPDMQNVNNWHWVEKNAEPWSRTQLEELFINQTVEKGSLKILLKDFKKLEGKYSSFVWFFLNCCEFDYK